MNWPDFSDPSIWMSLLTLTFLEIILGVDNVIFVSIIANKLEPQDQVRGRNIGLMLAMGFRLLLLLALSWLIAMDKPLFDVPFLTNEGAPIGLSAKDLILIVGGLFLLYKSVTEIHDKLEGKAHEAVHGAKKAKLSAVLVQIVLINLVFSFDSILTAIGLSKEIVIMMIAVVLSMGVMLLFSTAISNFINKHPTMQMLALSFLILIGFMLVAEGFHQHVSKGYVYFAIAFSLIVEVLNMRMLKAYPPVQLRGNYEEAEAEGLIEKN